jgi:hypothetical protein
MGILLFALLVCISYALTDSGISSVASECLTRLPIDTLKDGRSLLEARLLLSVSQQCLLQQRDI